MARAKEIMNSKSTKDSRWSVRLNGNAWLAIGIAAKLPRINNVIYHEDENAIIFSPFNRSVRQGQTILAENTTKAKTGDEIHFQFQPKLKMFSILFVSLIIVSYLYIVFQADEDCFCDIKEGIDYFPVIAGVYSETSATLFKAQAD